MRILDLVVVSLGLLTVFSGSAFGQYEAGAAIVAIDEKPAAGARKSGNSTGEAQGKNSSSVNSPSASQRKNVLGTQNKVVPKPVTSSAPITNSDPKYNGFVVGDKYTFLNFEIVSKVQPVHTIKAKEAGAAGLVQVEVLIDQNGNVLKAHARTGNPLLHPEAEKAALATKFNRPTFGGKPARAIGFIVYRFGKAEDDDYAYWPVVFPFFLNTGGVSLGIRAKTARTICHFLLSSFQTCKQFPCSIPSTLLANWQGFHV